MTTSWNKITEKLPEKEKDYLVWTGKYMIVSNAVLYDEETYENMRQHPFEGLEELISSLKEHKGYFKEFGAKYYFDDPKVYWAELPLAPGQEVKVQDPFEDMDEKSIYLKKDDTIIGLHAIGYAGEYEYTRHELDGTVTNIKTDFQELERWGNEYDEDHNMLGRGSFRVHTNIEECAKEFESDGFVRYEGPKRKAKS